MVESMNPELGGDDTITAGSGTNTIIGGLGNDTISAGAGTNIIFGDNGFIQYSAGVLSMVESMNPELGGDDTITAGTGTNTIIGGLGNDTISAGGGTNIIFGDNGLIQYTAGILSMVESMNPELGGDRHDHGGQPVPIRSSADWAMTRSVRVLGRT